MFNLICLIPASFGYHAIKNMFYVYHIIMSIKLIGIFCEINFYEDFDVVHLSPVYMNFFHCYDTLLPLYSITG